MLLLDALRVRRLPLLERRHELPLAGQVPPVFLESLLGFGVSSGESRDIP